MPSDMDGLFVHPRQLGDVSGAGVGAHQHRSRRLPHHVELFWRVDRHAAAVRQTSPVLPEMGLA
ncbi:MAG: hypothetical protein ACUVSV_11470 [Armatimonadota bacterium]